MKFGEIFICRFPFTSGTASKARPALVLFDLARRAYLPDHFRGERDAAGHHDRRLE
jgi:hypothetical protein